MKLEKLLEDIYPSSVSKSNINRKLRNDPLQDPKVGSGTFSSVSNKKNDPFMVRKTSDTTQGSRYDAKETDGYWQFIDGIIKNQELKSNPFLPRVYNIKTITDPTGKKVYRADIEKLIPITDIDPKLLITYLKNLFNKQLNDYLNIDKFNYKSNEYLITNLLGLIERASATNNYSLIDNEQLIQALQYIHTLSDKFIYDMHDENIMFRRGPYGIQLVITDPLSYPNK